MSLEELCARTIGSLYSTAFNLANGNSMLLNYKQLSVPVIASVLSFFKVSLSSEELETIARTCRVYSKEASGTRAFVDDAEAKQNLASDLVREMSERWASESYRLLEES
jgi:formyltetrahydrofolate synthetase